MTTSDVPQPPLSGAESELLTVIIPCLNEADMIATTVHSVLRVADTLPLDVRILMIDDGSTDGTGQAMELLCRAHDCCDMVVNPRNLGLGRSVLNAYSLVDPRSWVTVQPGDNEFIFDSIRAHLDVRDDYDVILGYLRNPVIRTLPRRVASYAFSKLVNTLYGFPYRYLNGMKLYRVDAFLGIEVNSSGHAFNAELLAKALLRNPFLRVGEVPFSARGRGVGTSKAFRVQSIWRAFRDVVAGYRTVARYRLQVIRDSAVSNDK
jgi:glycosyltransferase involved in cell wall biosynthesis